jgi:signal transduction histidine kinase/ligand-binding sensor domain-containing protein
LDNGGLAAVGVDVFKPRFHLFIAQLVFAWAVVTVPQSESAPVVATDGSIPVSEDYVLRTWGMEEGLPSNRVTSLTQTPDGYLWVGTLGGLTRFDGVRFTTFHAENTPGLESDRVDALFTARDGNLWVGLDRRGVARRVGDRFHVIAPLAPLTTGWTTSFAQDASGAVWFGYEDPVKVSRWVEGQLTDHSKQDGLAVGNRGAHGNKVASTANGTIWYANTAGCGPFDGKRFQSIDPAGGGGEHLAPAGDGGMWAKRGYRLVRYHPDGSQETVADLSALFVSMMMEDSSGTLWVGTSNAGLMRFRDGNWARVPVEGGSVSSVFEDREGDIWVGTPSAGVSRLHARRFHLRQTKDGLLDDDTFSVCADNEGRLWVAGRNNMLVRATDATNRRFTVPSGWPDGLRGIMTVHSDPTGGVWVGTGNGLLHMSEGTFRRESLLNPVTALLVDRNEILWAAIIKGPLVRRQAGQDVRMPETGGLIRVISLAEDAAGRIWAGTEDGLVFQKSGEPFVPVPLPGAQPGDGIRFIVPDGPDTVWIGALRGGLYRWRDGRISRLPGGAGLPIDDLRSLMITAEGDFWLGTASGLLRVARDEIEPVMDGRQASLHCTAYGRDDGLPSTEFSLGFRGATTRTPDGHLWFATARGALEILPKEKPSPAIAALPMLIEEVRVGGTAMGLNGDVGLLIPPRSGPLEIRYTLAQLSGSERLRFRYRLSGLGSGAWVDTDRQRTALFTYLPPGDYRFEVAAAGADGTWLPTTASLALTVRATWWETSWFRSVVGLLGALALAALVKFAVKRRMRARMRKLEQENALERERTRLARDLHDQVGASLTHIALQVEAATSPDSRARLADSVRQTVDDLDGVVWATNPINDTLDSLLQYLVRFSWDFLKPADVRLRIDFPDEVPSRILPPEFRYHVLLVVREALNNAVKYSAASEIHLGASFSSAALTITVADNGRGFDPVTCGAGGNGLSNMRQRAATLSGECRIDSRPGAGARVTLIVPWFSTGSVLPKSAAP